MPKIKVPDFMRELHKIRAKLSRKWKKMSNKEIIESLHESHRWFKTQLGHSSLK